MSNLGGHVTENRTPCGVQIRLNAADWMLSGFYTVLTVALLTRHHPFSTYAGFFILHLLVIAGILVLAACANLNRGCRLLHDWFPTLVFVAAFEETARLSLAFSPHWHDAVILHAEAVIFSIPPTVWLSRLHAFWITELLEFGYFTFYWIMFVVGGVLYRAIWKSKSLAVAADPRQPFRTWMDATVLGYVVCYAFYLLFPTEGPAHTLPHQFSTAFTGPFHWLVRLIQQHAGVHGNAFPSGHIMASVVALLAAAKWKPRLARWLTLPVLLMCVGAVYDGYHYAFDIFAGAILGATAFWIVCTLRTPHLPESADVG